MLQAKDYPFLSILILSRLICQSYQTNTFNSYDFSLYTSSCYFVKMYGKKAGNISKKSHPLDKMDEVLIDNLSYKINSINRQLLQALFNKIIDYIFHFLCSLID